MYEAHYNLSGDPFRLRPRFGMCFEHASYKKAQSYLLYALQRGEGLLLVTGMPGTGKTSLVRDCSRQFTNQNVKFIEVSSGNLNAEDVVFLIANRLGVVADGQRPIERLAALEKELRKMTTLGSRIILVIDEAQSLTDEALDEIKNLSNMEYMEAPLLQFFLVGQKSLRDRLQKPELSQVMQRITAACEIQPMDYEDLVEYVRYCLKECQWDGVPDIEAAALRTLHQYSEGIPRRVNLIAGRLLLKGMVDDLVILGEREIDAVIEDLQHEGLLPKLGAANAS